MVRGVAPIPDKSIGTLKVKPERLTDILNSTAPWNAGTTFELDPLTNGGVWYSVLLRGTPNLVLVEVEASPWIRRSFSSATSST